MTLKPPKKIKNKNPQPVYHWNTHEDGTKIIFGWVYDTENSPQWILTAIAPRRFIYSMLNELDGLVQEQYPEIYQKAYEMSREN